MSVKISSRQNSRRKPLVDNAQSEVLFKLGLEAFWTTPLDPASMLDINTWNLENQPPVVPKYLPHAFLQRLWLLNPEARSTYCQPSPDSQANTQREDMVNGFGEESQCAANPLDLVTAVFMSANTFLQQDITVRMVQCQFAVPLVLPSVIPDQQSSFLLWPLRGVVSQWRSHSLSGVLEGDLASTKMPMMSFVKLGHCGVSKSWVLSRVLSGPKSLSQSFLHRGMDGGKLHRRLSNGLVELAWYLPTGDPDTDIFPVPVAISNLRGDAAAHEKCLSLLCRASSAVVVFCGNLREKEKRLLASWKGTASKIILIDLSDPGEEENENRVVGFLEQKLGDELGLPEGSVLSGGAVSEELLADRLLETLNDLLPGKLKHVTLEEAAGIAAELGLNVDEGAVCNKARATVEEVLKGLEEGSAQFREVQLPLQGQAWSTLSEMEKEASKQKKGEVNIEQQNEARNILLKLSSYRMTPAMKVFTDALFTTDKIERTYFLRWMKLSLRAKQMRELHSLQGSIKNQQELLVQGSQEVETELTNENVIETENAVNRTIVGDDADDDSFCTASTEEENKSVEDMLAEKPLSMDHTEENELDTEHDVNVHVAGDSHINYDLESSCSEDLTENQKLETQACHIAQSEEVKLNSVLPDAGEVALNNSFEESTDENMESEVEPVHQPSDDESFVTASTEEENNSVEDMLEENPLSMDHSEESDPQLPAQQTKPELGTANDVNVHVAGDSPIKHDLESSCSEDLIENQKLETEAGHIAQSEEEKLNSVALNNSLEQSTDENMESEEEPVLGPSDDDSFCTASTEEENISVEDMLEEKPLSMDHTEESEPQLLDQQTKPELDTEYDVNVHVAGDSPIKHDLESSCAERLIQEMLGRLLRETEIQKLETQAGHIVQSEEVKLNSVLSDAGEVALINLLEDSTDENMESEEEPAHRPSDDSFFTASTEEENNSVEDMLEEKPLSMDHTEESEPQVPEQQTELELETDIDVKVQVAGDSPIQHDLESSCAERLIQEMLGRLLRQTEIQKLETQAGHIVQSEEVKLNSVLPDAGEVALNNLLEESTDENMESEDELAHRPSDDSFCTASTEEENNSVEDMLEEKPLSMDHSEESDPQLPAQQTKPELGTANDVNVHVAGDSPIKHDLESSCSEDLIENQKLETEAGHIAQSEEDKLNSVALNNSLEQSTDENMESEEEPALGPSDDDSFCTASTEEENISVEDMLEEKPLSMDHTEESEPQLLDQQTKPELDTEYDVNVHVAGDSPIKHDLESSCAERLIQEMLGRLLRETEIQKLETQAGHIVQSEEVKLNSVLSDAGEVALINLLEDSTDENMESEEEPAHRPSDDSFFTASTEEENNSVEDMLEEKPLSMDHTEESEPQVPEQQTELELETDIDVKVQVAGDSPIQHDLESSCAERLIQEMLGRLLRQTEIQKLETQAGHIVQSEEVKLNSVLPDAGEVALNNLLEESTDENMESEDELAHRPSDDSFCTASTEEENNSVEDMLEEKPLSMDHSEESDPQLPAQQTKPELGTANDVNVHVAGDSPIKHDLESSCSEDLIENQKLETEAGHIAQSEEDKLNSVALNNSLEQSTDENMESEEEPALGPSDDDSFCTASTEEENISVEDMLEEKPLSMDHTEESEPQLLDQQTKPELDTEYDVNVHVAGDSPIKHDLESSCAERLIQEMLGRLLRETEIQKLETQAGHIVQSEEVKLNSVLSDAGEVALINLLEDSTDENMESEEEPAHRPSDDSFCTASTEEENNSVEDMLEEKPLSIDHTEESEPQVPEQQTELDMDNEVKVHVAGDSPLKHDLESNCSEDLTEIQKLGHIAQCEEVQLSTVLPDAGEVAPNHSIEESNNENMESEEELVKKYSEMQDGEQNLSPQTPENADLVLRPTTADQNELEPTIEQQIYLTPDENRTMGPESTEIQDSFEDQEIIDQVNSADQQYHLESETMGEESEVPKIESQQTDSNPSVQNNLDLMDFSKKNNTDTVSLGFEPDPFSLSLEHFLREMGLIFELTHISPGNGSHNVLRLPSLAADLLLYGIPLELMDGDASNIPSSWLGCVLAEFKRRLPADGVRIRVLTNLGVYPARNGEVLSALFGANFPTRGKGFIKGIYMQPLCLPGELRRDMECDLLLMIDVEGLCSPESGREAATQVHDNEMATVATGLSDVLLHNLASNGAAKFESNLTVLINALLRTEVCGNTPVCKLLIQDEGLNSKLQALQLGRVAGILQAEPEKIEIKNNQKPISHIKSSIPCLIGPWQNISISQPVDKRYSEVVLQLKQSLFEAFGKCAAKSKATGLPEFMRRLCAIWEAVKAESFSIGLGNTEVAASFSMMCTELSQWEKLFLENMEIWFMGAQKRITSTKTEASETRVKGKLLSLLKDEVKEEVKAEVDKIRSKLEAYLIQNDQNKTYIETYHPNIMNNMNELQEQVTEEMIERLELAKDNHYLSTHLRTFEAFLEKEQELKLRMLVENSKLTTVLLEDMQLEEEFEPVWDNALSTFDLRPSQTSDINSRVIEILIDNLNSRGLQKHMIRLQKIIKKNTAGFEVHDEHFGYNTRMKYMFEDNNKKQRLAAHRVACTIIEEYNRFVAEKSNLLADFSDGYITELLENVEKTLRANPMEIRSAFEVDLKVYICGFARKDFQEIHDRYAKDRDLLAFIKRSKERRQGEFIYQFRKRDQCHRVAQAFTSMVFKPTALDYIYESLGRHIVEEMVSQENGQQYLSPLAFNCSLLEKLLDEDSFGSFLEYLLSYESFSLKKIQERVLHLSKSAIFDEWRRQRLGEIVGKMSAAVSQTSVGVSEKLSDTKLLLEMVCLNLEKERDVAVTRASLDGPLFSITVEWDYFVSCLLEALAEMRLALAHEFSQDTDIAELLQALPVQPQESLFNRVRGCEKQCPFCRAPCEVGGVVHDMHRAVLHRPKGMLSYTYHDSCSLSHTSCLSDTTKENLFLNKDTDGQSLAYRDYSSIYPDWSIHPVEPDTKTPIAYWRYVLMRFNERFAEEYEQQPAQLPDDWLHITREEALESLREASTLSSVGGYHNNYTL